MKSWYGMPNPQPVETPLSLRQWEASIFGFYQSVICSGINLRFPTQQRDTPVYCAVLDCILTLLHTPNSWKLSIWTNSNSLLLILTLSFISTWRFSPWGKAPPLYCVYSSNNAIFHYQWHTFQCDALLRFRTAQHCTVFTTTNPAT